ncbi:hypothetical protein [Maledivibacter halophilus]|uniref:Uncharacterized protein n=1 Tax=Maledivibacter halophilus TaxID=36842 RepID=A0A1T5K345_9FIRM|nr:hypothetical protein [Maledivibacter halophilus]SKC58126.1 hypothetical protein SAMN02194393_01585 [Maledivibacter halophilus]
MKKFRVLSLVIVFMLMFSSVAMAAGVPSNIVIIGNKAYELELLDDASYIPELQRAVAEANGSILFKTPTGNLKNAVDMTDVEESVLPDTITLKKADGTTEEIEIDHSVVVESVSAIDKTIELNVAAFEAEEDATAKVAIFALDDEGAKTGTAIVTANSAEIIDNVVTFDVSSKTFGDDEYVVEVTIGEATQEVNVALEFDAVETLVADINAATAAQLATLLADEAYFTGFDVAKVDAYYTAKEAAKPLSTVAEVQEDVVDAVAANSEFDAFEEELTDAEVTSEYAKYLVLKGQFSNVLDANMDAYMDTAGPIFDTDLNTLDGAMTDFDAISDAIDVINLDAVVAGDDGIVFGSIDGSKPSELNAYKSALEALVLVNDEVTDSNGDTKAEIIEAIDAELEAIADAREAADAEIVKAETALADFVAANGEVPAEGAVTEYDDLVAAIEALEKEDLTKTELALTTLTPAIAALEAETLDLTIVQDAKDAMADFEAAWKVAYDEDYTTGSASYDALAGSVTTLEGDPTDATALAALKADVNTSGSVKHLGAETEKLVIYADALNTKSAAEMRTLLFDLQPANEFTNLTPNAAKAEFAQYVIDALAEEATAPADFDALQTAIFTTGYLGDYTTLISDVNGAADIAAMITALEAISEDYDALGAEAKADIAGVVFEVKADLETIAEIEAAMGL